jgi:hypothetical protein
MAIVRNIQNNTFYRYLGDNKYRNLITGAEGEITEELARKIFKINVEMTSICEDFPDVEKLIQSLQLKADKNEDTTNSGS